MCHQNHIKVFGNENGMALFPFQIVPTKFHIETSYLWNENEDIFGYMKL